MLAILLAKGFDIESVEILKKKKNLRIIDISDFKPKNLSSIKSFDGSFLIQSKDDIVLEDQVLQPTSREV